MTESKIEAPVDALNQIETSRSIPLFDAQLDRLAAIVDAVLSGKKVRWEELLPAPSSPQAEGKKAKQVDPSAPPSIAIVRARSGLGKTTLLERFAGRLDFPCEFLCCQEGWTKPFHMFDELLGSLEDTFPAFDRLLERYRWGFAAVFPELSKEAQPAAVGKHTFFAALAGLLLDVARQQPFALVIEDLNWADPAVLEFLGFLGRSLRQATAGRDEEAPSALRRKRDATEQAGSPPPRLVVVGSLTPPETEADAFDEGMLDLCNEPYVATIDLPDFDRQGLQRLASLYGLPKLADGAWTRLLEIADRNTFLSRLLVSQLAHLGPEIDGSELVARAEAVGAEGIVRAAMAELPEPARLLLAVLAIFRRPVREDAISVFLDRGPSEVKQLAEIAHGRGFLRQTALGWCLANSLCSVQAQQLLTPAEAKRWNDRIAESFPASAAGPGLEEDYAFFQHAVRGGSPACAAVSGLRAADFLTRNFAFQRALVVLYNLLGILGAGEEPARRLLGIKKQIIDLEEGIGRGNAAKQNLKRLLIETPESELGGDERAELTMRLGQIYQKQGRLSRALKVLRRAFGKKVGPEVTARIYGAIASVRIDRGESKKALNYCLRGLSYGQKDADFPVRAELRSLLSRIYRVRGDYALAVDSLLQALESEEKTRLELDTCPILDQLGQLYLEQGNYFRAARYLYRSLEVKRNAHDLPGLASSYTALGEVYSRSGNFAKAIEEQRKACEIHEILGDWRELVCNLIDMGNTFLRLGNLRSSAASLRRAIAIAEKSGQTESLVAAFVSLAEASLFLGDTRQAENLLRQVEILAQEYDLRAFLARGEQLAGNVCALRRTWDEGVRRLKKARDLYASLGERFKETEAKLDLASLFYDRELFSEALKAVSQAHVSADELRSPLLQARSLLIKGNIYRFIDGGRHGKWRECFDRALEVARSVGDVNLHFEILYALGRAYHDDQSFEFADSRYRKAQEILDRVAGDLNDDEATRFWADKRRQVFREDYDRLRRESGGRIVPLAGYEKGGETKIGVAPAAYEDLLGKINRLNLSLTHAGFFAQVLGLALDLVRADRGFLVEVGSDGWQYAAFRGLRPEALTGRLSYAETLISEVLRQRRIVVTTGRDEEEKYGSRANLAGLRDRVAILVPILSNEAALGVLYLDRAAESESDFAARAEALLGQFAAHVQVAWENRRTFLSATMWPGTPFLVEPYFFQVVRQAKEQEERGGNHLALLGIRLSCSLREIAGRRARSIHYVIGRDRSVGVLSDSLLLVLLSDCTTPKEVSGAAQDIVARLKKIVEIRGHRLLMRESLGGNPTDWVQAIREQLEPSGAIFDEIQSLAGRELGLREAKQLLEKHVIMKALSQAHGNITKAAQLLGIHRPQLSQLVRRHDLKRDAFTQAAARP